MRSEDRERRRSPLRLFATAIASLALVAALAGPSAHASLVGGVEHLRTNCDVGSLIAGPDGNVWFTLTGGAYPPTKSRPSAIGRVTPSGEFTLFKNGLRPGSNPGEIVAGADGGVWFTQVFDLPHGNDEPGGLIGRLGPEGALSSFGSGPAALGAPIAGPDGNVWFVGDNGKVGIDRVTPAGEISQFSTPGLGVPSHLVAGPDDNVWFTAQQSIGRVTPSGEITSFTDCMDYRQDFSEATTIVAGPGGDLWFTSATSRQLPSMGEPATIGRVTPSGEITLFKAGIRSEPTSIVAGADGRVYFAGGFDEIERITPPDAPVNTFVFAPGRATAGGGANLTVEVPGPGRFELRPLALLLPGGRPVRPPGAPIVRTAARTCGPTSLHLRLRGGARTMVRHGRGVKLKVRATFTPTGGSPDAQVETILLRKPKQRH